jgi:cytochrome c peroxidase
LKTFLHTGLFILLLATSCKVDEPVPVVMSDGLTDADVAFNIPAGFPSPPYTFFGNTPTVEGFRLGRKLFYDQQLSRDNSISCADCHQQFAAFANLDHPLSHGVDNQFGVRNSPPLFNLPWMPGMMWDGGVTNFEVQPFAPITNPVEMDQPIPVLIAKLNASNEYKLLFKAAFGDDSITSARIFKSLVQFMGLMTSANSKYDQYLKGQTTLTTAEGNGLNIFRSKCASCHVEPLLTDHSFRSNGLNVDAILQDSGRATITQLASDLYKFKVPSLRNVSRTWPYMHDGRFNTLDEVYDHYATIDSTKLNLDTVLRNGIQLTSLERSELTAFLNTLTDFSFINDQRFKDPDY